MDSNYTKPINLGNPEEITMNDLAIIIKKLTKSKSIIINKDLPEDDPKKRKPNINKATYILNWKPKTNLTKGLIHTIYHYMNI